MRSGDPAAASLPTSPPHRKATSAVVPMDVKCVRSATAYAATVTSTTARYRRAEADGETLIRRTTATTDTTDSSTTSTSRENRLQPAPAAARPSTVPVDSSRPRAAGASRTPAAIPATGNAAPAAIFGHPHDRLFIHVQALNRATISSAASEDGNNDHQDLDPDKPQQAARLHGKE
ncbi:hypothetical protein [Arthrobacter sp. K5]|uniref:Uncharacterized protein n=1 Tax=Arthrobacter sp. K5 TaxID=2839623 RepID=A0AAU8EW83_9MICC